MIRFGSIRFNLTRLGMQFTSLSILMLRSEASFESYNILRSDLEKRLKKRGRKEFDRARDNTDSMDYFSLRCTIVVYVCRWLRKYRR